MGLVNLVKGLWADSGARSPSTTKKTTKSSFVVNHVRKIEQVPDDLRWGELNAATTVPLPAPVASPVVAEEQQSQTSQDLSPPRKGSRPTPRPLSLLVPTPSLDLDFSAEEADAPGHSIDSPPIKVESEGTSPISPASDRSHSTVTMKRRKSGQRLAVPARSSSTTDTDFVEAVGEQSSGTPVAGAMAQSDLHETPPPARPPLILSGPRIQAKRQPFTNPARSVAPAKTDARLSDSDSDSSGDLPARRAVTPRPDDLSPRRAVTPRPDDPSPRRAVTPRPDELSPRRAATPRPRTPTAASPAAADSPRAALRSPTPQPTQPAVTARPSTPTGAGSLVGGQRIVARGLRTVSTPAVAQSSPPKPSPVASRSATPNLSDAPLRPAASPLKPALRKVSVDASPSIAAAREGRRSYSVPVMASRPASSMSMASQVSRKLESKDNARGSSPPSLLFESSPSSSSSGGGGAARPQTPLEGVGAARKPRISFAPDTNDHEQSPATTSHKKSASAPLQGTPRDQIKSMQKRHRDEARNAETLAAIRSGRLLPDTDDFSRGPAQGLWDASPFGTPMPFAQPGPGMMPYPTLDPFQMQQMLLHQQQQINQMQMASAMSYTSSQHSYSGAIKTPPPTPPSASAMPKMVMAGNGHAAPGYPSPQAPLPFSLASTPAAFDLPPNLLVLPPEYQQAYLAQVYQMQAQMQSQMQLEFAMARSAAEREIVAMASNAGSTM